MLHHLSIVDDILLCIFILEKPTFLLIWKSDVCILTVLMIYKVVAETRCSVMIAIASVNYWWQILCNGIVWFEMQWKNIMVCWKSEPWWWIDDSDDIGINFNAYFCICGTSILTFTYQFQALLRICHNFLFSVSLSSM